MRGTLQARRTPGARRALLFFRPESTFPSFKEAPMRKPIALSLGLLAALAVLAAAAKTYPEKKPAAKTADLPAVAASINDFAVDLYGRLRKDEGNLFFSPTSISTALAMTYGGAAGKTAQEMKATLRFSLDGDDLHQSYGAMLKRLVSTKKGCKIYIANALWGQKETTFLAPFLALTKKSYGAGLRKVDFVKATEKARKAINGWVEKKTMKKIKELIQQGVLTQDSRLVLTNAIYFKGAWSTPFKKNNTEKESFTTAEAKDVTVDMMHLEDKTFRYAKKTGLAALEMPYKGGGVSMVILLPEKKDGLPALEASLTTKMIDETVASLKDTELLDVAVPRFTTTYGLDLADTLKAMGMPSAFADADFSGMTGTMVLRISAVIHKAFVDVNEQGTEAAAATAVIMTKAGKMPSKPVFRADHPFILLIRDTQTGAILFMGRITDPTAAST
jgi:serpin B